MSGPGYAAVNLPTPTPAGIAAALEALPAWRLLSFAHALRQFPQTSNFTPAAPGTYAILAPGLMMALPMASLGGDIVVVDKTGAPNLTISGAIVNAPSSPLLLTAAYASLRLRWSVTYSGWVLI
jgi:hypothetical protein